MIVLNIYYRRILYVLSKVSYDILRLNLIVDHAFLQNIVFFGKLPFVPAFTGRDSQVQSVGSQCSSSRDHEHSIPPHIAMTQA